MLIIKILSQFLAEEILCVAIIKVIFLLILLIFDKIFSSVSVSTADKLSSKINIFGLLIIALAIASLCFCPPDRLTPLSPSNVLKPSLNISISLDRHAFLAAISTSFKDALFLPNFIFFSIDSENRNVD